jgi:cytochrome c oxidase cbb3-type subunit 3
MQKILKNFMITTGLFLAGASSLWAADGPKPPSSLSNPFVELLAVVIVILAVLIYFLAKLVIDSAFVKRDKEKKESSASAITFYTILFLLISVTGFSQDKAAADTTAQAAPITLSSQLHGVSETAYYLLGSVVLLEILIITALLFMLKTFIAAEKKAVAVEITGKPVVAKTHWWDKVNDFKPLHQEADLDLGHDYDGIRELDNRLPPWWLYGFYCCIIFAGIYLWRYHVAQSAPLSKEEYEISVAKADAEKAAYLEKAASNVDENTVTLLTDQASLDAGKKNFETICAACHMPNGAGSVGPNLTDDYWLHGGSIKDVFKTIKYGWQDKGMKSWKDDFSPIQIAQLASYVKSLHGTNPPGGKAPQGTLYVEAGTPASTNPATPTDSTKK